MANLNISSLNCRGLGTYNKRQYIAELFKINSIDICFLQETHCYSKFVANSWEKQWGGTCFWSFGSNRSRGVGIWIREGLNFTTLNYNRDSEGRIVSILIKINTQFLKLTNIYAPVIPKERKIFFSSLAYYLKSKHPNILGGDFNCVINNKLDKKGGNDIYGELASDNLQSVCNDFKIIDAFRNKHINKKEYTWENALKNIQIRLDRMYISQSIITQLSNISHLKITDRISDHDMVVLSLNINITDENKIGSSYWKCNTNTLKDLYFQENFKLLWEKLNKIENQNSKWWEECKLSFKKLIIAHSIRLALIKKDKHKETSKILSELLHNNRSEDQNKISLAQKELEILINESIEGTKIRSKVTYLEENEKPTRFFLQREKQLAENKVIHQLIKSDGTVITNNQDIQNECVSFYTDLYKKDSIDISLQSFFFENIPTLTEDAATTCEGYITLAECKRALNSMSNQKTPGSDGLPKEFYVFAFPYIGDSFVNFLNHSLDVGVLAPSQRKGLITLICKDTNNAHTLKNWRPISLLNTDYKMLSKVLTNRLNKVIEHIVHPDQTCSIPGRTIQNNVHLIRNIVEYTNNKNMSAAIISLDQSKAFDRVSHEYLFNVLTNFGFKKQFISLVKLLYTDIQSSVLVNGFITKDFSVERSVRQGCSLSPLLYVLCMEPFAHRIRMDPMVKGIPLPGTKETATISQYADDTSLFISDITSVKHILQLIQLYGNMSGALINLDKTFGMWLGKWRGRVDQPCNLKWSSNSQKFFGIYIGDDKANNRTWDKVINKFQQCVKLYNRRDLSLKGRSVILQTVLCTSIWYVGSLILMPKKVENTLNKLIFSFLWNNKPEAIKRATLIHTFINGGLNIIDINTKLASFRIKQILQLIKGEKVKWKYFAVYWIGLNLRKYVSEFNSLTIPHSENIPNYYKTALLHFQQFEKLCPEFMQRQIITTKFLYHKVLELKTETPRVEQIYPLLDFIQIWSYIQCEFVDSKYRDLAYRIAHQILPTQNLLYKYNITRNCKCFLCKRKPESLSHLFYECDVLKGLWPFIASIIFEITGCTVKISTHVILFNVLKPHTNFHFTELLLLLVNMLKYCIWIKRNEVKHEQKKISNSNIKAFFINTLTLRIKADFNRLNNNTFLQYWGNNNSIYIINNNKLQVQLNLYQP